MMVILLNCVTLGMYQPCENIDCSSDRCQILQAFDAFIYIFFALEMVVKMVALGIFGRRCYMGDTWNRLDFFIVMAGAARPLLNRERTLAFLTATVESAAGRSPESRGTLPFFFPPRIGVEPSFSHRLALQPWLFAGPEGRRRSEGAHYACMRILSTSTRSPHVDSYFIRSASRANVRSSERLRPPAARRRGGKHTTARRQQIEHSLALERQR
ncbi:hypothetical protein SKAU_G00120340 [Synaphobranchus kaupii]|uniref:Ion transport domain-containing protein n=1 Tax=Synaphobranchus kaupii TaxID=118154 RepID=A0A9Q1FP75_SYNKA|nr:hypothetical protein SKAU_G00120340 [Synaphobranchus kaupii]